MQSDNSRIAPGRLLGTSSRWTALPYPAEAVSLMVDSAHDKESEQRLDPFPSYGLTCPAVQSETCPRNPTGSFDTPRSNLAEGKDDAVASEASGVAGGK